MLSTQNKLDSSSAVSVKIITRKEGVPWQTEMEKTNKTCYTSFKKSGGFIYNELIPITSMYPHVFVGNSFILPEYTGRLDQRNYFKYSFRMMVLEGPCQK